MPMGVDLEASTLHAHMVACCLVVCCLWVVGSFLAKCRLLPTDVSLEAFWEFDLADQVLATCGFEHLSLAVLDIC